MVRKYFSLLAKAIFFIFLIIYYIVRRDLDKLLTLDSVQMNLYCTLLIAVMQSRRSEYQEPTVGGRRELKIDVRSGSQSQFLSEKAH